MPKSRLRRITAAFLSSFIVLLCIGVPNASANVLFEDYAQRADSNSPGPNWQEYFLRESEGRIPRQGDTPWCIKGNSLYYVASGQNSYIEDFIQTADTFAVDNTTIEFDFRGSGGTTAGYVGPIVLWATVPEQRSGYTSVRDGRQAIGAGAWYRWENAGTKGVMVYRNGTFMDYSNGLFAGLNQSNFSHHIITVKNNTITYQSDSFAPVTLPLTSPLASGEKRHLSLGVRLYDQGQIAEFRNIRLNTDSSNNTDNNTNITTTHHPGGDQLATADEYSLATLEFLQLVLDGKYDAAMQKTSDTFQQENTTAGLENLRTFIDQHRAEGQVVGKSISQKGDGVEVIIYLEYADFSRVSIHLSFSQGKITGVMGRWGR